MKTTFFSCKWIFIILGISILGCKKNPPATTKTGDSTFSNDSCSATLADADSIEIFPADNAWNQDISAQPVDPYSDQIIASFASSGLKADFGSGLWDNAPIGIPFVVVCGNQPKIQIVFRANSYDGNYGD